MSGFHFLARSLGHHLMNGYVSTFISADQPTQQPRVLSAWPPQMNIQPKGTLCAQQKEFVETRTVGWPFQALHTISLGSDPFILKQFDIGCSVVVWHELWQSRMLELRTSCCKPQPWLWFWRWSLRPVQYHQLARLTFVQLPGTSKHIRQIDEGHNSQPEQPTRLGGLLCLSNLRHPALEGLGNICLAFVRLDHIPSVPNPPGGD